MKNVQSYELSLVFISPNHADSLDTPGVNGWRVTVVTNVNIGAKAAVLEGLWAFFKLWGRFAATILMATWTKTGRCVQKWDSGRYFRDANAQALKSLYFSKSAILIYCFMCQLTKEAYIFYMERKKEVLFVWPLVFTDFTAVLCLAILLTLLLSNLQLWFT